MHTEQICQECQVIDLMLMVKELNMMLQGMKEHTYLSFFPHACIP